jgi:diguanylate cyclase (GGDEF)-like protein/PAS domain S-box-containing protein
MLVLGGVSLAFPAMPWPASAPVYLGVGFVPVVAAASVATQLGGGRRRVWWLIAAGSAVTVLGDAIWTAQDVLSGGVPTPGPADVAYLVGVPLLVVAILRLAADDDVAVRRRTLLDAAIVATCAALLLWLVAGSALVSAADGDLAALAVHLAYPLLDAAGLGAIAAMFFGRRLRTISQLLLAASVALKLGSDVAFLVLDNRGTYVAGELTDVGWLLAYSLLAAAALHPSVATPLAPVPDRPDLRPAHLLGLGVPMAAVGVAIVAVTVRDGLDDPSRLRLDVAVTAPIGVLLVALLLGRLLVTNRALGAVIDQRDLAYRREVVVAEVASQLSVADDVDAVRRAVAGAVALVDRPGGRIELWVPAADADPRPASELTTTSAAALVVPLTPDPSEGALIVVAEPPIPDSAVPPLERVASDVVMALDRCRLVQELRASEQRFGSLIRNAPDAITVHDADGMLTYASPALSRITATDAAELVGTRWDARFHPDDQERVHAAHARAVAGDRGTAIVEARVAHAEGGWRWVEIRITNLLSDPTVAGVVTNQRDTTERQRLQRQLQHAADHDPLTGLANRRRFGQVVHDELERRRPTAVLFLDLDRFKPVNDRHGHAFGDRLLTVVADRLRSVVREPDVGARLGGDEFAVLLPDTDLDTATAIAERIHAVVRAPVRIDDVTVEVDASIGVAADDLGGAGRDLLRDADLAMYAAKQSGRSQVRRADALVAGQPVGATVAASHGIDEDLRIALEEGHLSPTYRPVHRLADDELVGAEAGVAWHHPVRGAVPQLELRAAARRLGADAAITGWILREACWLARSCADLHPGFGVAVRIGDAELADDGFADDVEGVLASTGLTPSALTLEVTGTALSCGTPAGRAALTQLREVGVRVRLADLGTNETPVQRLRSAPVDELAIAPELTATIDGACYEDTVLVRALLQLAETFQLPTIAADLERATQRDALRRRGVVTGVGPLWGSTLSGEELITRVTRTPGSTTPSTMSTPSTR